MYCIMKTKDALSYPAMVGGKTFIRTKMFENDGTLFQRI